jgi:uncharacterized protein YdiU (UPF0061 family)
VTRVAPSFKRCGSFEPWSASPENVRARLAYGVDRYYPDCRAAAQGDAGEIDVLLDLLRDPYTERPGFESYAALPPEWASQLEVSCSS